MSLQLKQGNVILEKISQIPPSAWLEDASDGEIVVGGRDSLGKTHVISSAKARSFAVGRNQYIDANAGARLMHEDHSPIELDQAAYKVIKHIEQVMQGHGRRVSRLALLIGEALGFDDDHLRDLAFAARVHDVAVTELPDEIMWKAGPLTAHERSVMSEHAAQGAEIVGKHRNHRVKRYILHHHEHLDGSGYPGGLSGESIPIGARIISVTDVYDALTTDRSYRKSFDHDAAIAEMRLQSGKQLDALLVEVLVACLGN